jgi:exonuclease VII large subunit
MRAAPAAPMVRGVAMAELTDPASGKPLVLRVEISAEGGGTLSVPALEAGLRALAPPPPAPAPAAVPDAELERRAAELERRATKLDEAERRLNERELELEAGSGNTVSDKIRLASREKRLAQIEEELEGRMSDVDEREDALETREAEFEADVELREQRIERWRAELTELEQRLDRKETELTLYVGELQGELSKREPGWWPAAERPLRHH